MEDRDNQSSDLKSVDEEVRRQAVKALGMSGEKGSLDLLVEALGDPSWRVRKEASEAILAFNDPLVIDKILPGLRDGTNAGRRNSVVETLIQLGTKVIPHVASLLNDDDHDVRKFAVDILGGLDSHEVIPFLMEALKDDDDNIIAASTEYLGKKGDFRAIPPLLLLLSKDSYWLKFCALQAIGQLADEEQEDEVLEFLEDPSLRSETISVLSRIGGKKAFLRLINCYNQSTARDKSKIMVAMKDILYRRIQTDEAMLSELVKEIENAGLKNEFEIYLAKSISGANEEERQKSIAVAAYVPSPAIMETLIGIIELVEEEDREDICRSLSMFPEEYLPCLFNYLASDSTIIKRKVVWVLGQHHYKPALPRMLPLVQDEDGHVRSSVARSLGHIGDKSAIMPLYNLLSDPYPDVRESAVDALTEIASSDSSIARMICDIIISSFDNDTETFAEGSLLVLGNIGDMTTIPVFARFLKDARVKVRRAALMGLGRLKTESAMDIILKALTDEDPDMRMEAIRFLGKTADEKYRAAVIAKVNDEDPMVAAEALLSLGSFGGEASFEVLVQVVQNSTGLRQLSAIRALSSIGGTRVLTILTGILPVVSVEGKKEIVTFFGKTKDRRNITFLLPCLEDPEWSVRLSAVSAIKRIGDQQTMALVMKDYYPKENDLMVRRAMENLSPSKD